MKRLLIILAGLALTIGFAAGTVSAECSVCGDLTGDGQVNIADITAFVDWYYNWPNPITPACPGCADVDCDGGVTTQDLDYLVDYMFNGGPPPCDPDDDGTADCDPC